MYAKKTCPTKEHQNNKQVDQAARIIVAQVDLDWEHKAELLMAQWARDSLGHLRRDATYRWARVQVIDLTAGSSRRSPVNAKSVPQLSPAPLSPLPLTQSLVWARVGTGRGNLK